MKEKMRSVLQLLAGYDRAPDVRRATGMRVTRA